MIFVSSRKSAAKRREQIAIAALELLAEVPVGGLSTRMIARRVGISQPGLFRHFRSRDGILLEAIALTRGQLAGLAEAVLEQQADALQKLGALARGLLTHIEHNPGLPRLLMSDAHPHDGPVRVALKQLLGMQHGLATELIRQAQAQGTIDRQRVDPKRAATLFVGFLQGVSLQWQMADRKLPLAEEADPLFTLWLDGVRCSNTGERAKASAHPAADESATDLEEADPNAAHIIALDVRPILAEGVDPLDQVLTVLPTIGRAGVLKITVPFRPAPLLALIRSKGYTVSAQELSAKHWLVEVVGPDAPAIEDLRDLDPPEPLERVLGAAAKLETGTVFLARLPRFPRLLLPRLQERSVSWSVHEEPDGSALLLIRRAQ